MNRYEKKQKIPRKMDQRLIIHEAEHNNLLKILKKNLEIPQECTYANQKAIDTEVGGMKYSSRK